MKNSVLSQENNFGLPSYSFSEELVNSITHGLGIAFSVFAFIFLFMKFWSSAGSLVAVSIYSLTLIILYTGSTLYHSVKTPKLKSSLRKFDHCSIFLLIAGTYTPLCTIYINGIGSKIILIFVWLLAIIGVIINMIDVNKFSKISLSCYILMGWSVVFIAKPTIQALSANQLKWLFAGGVFYTFGAVLYVLGKKMKYMHSIWHLFVLAGTVCHFAMLA